MSYFLVPLIVIGALIVVLGVFVVLARIQNGRFLRPVIAFLSKVPWIKRQFQKVSQAAIERSNPELASAMRKIQRVGPNPDEKRMQAAYHSLSAAERRAYQEFADSQGMGTVEGANREQRRRLAKHAQTNRPKTGGGGSAPKPGGAGASGRRKRK